MPGHLAITRDDARRLLQTCVTTATQPHEGETVLSGAEEAPVTPLEPPRTEQAMPGGISARKPVAPDPAAGVPRTAESAATGGGTDHSIQQQDPVLVPTYGGRKTPGQQTRALANTVIKMFRKTGQRILDITDGLGASLTDDQGNGITFDWKIFIHDFGPDQK